MPTHLLLPFVDIPDGLGQDSLVSSSASMPGLGSSMTPHSTTVEKAGESVPLSCMFCEQTFTHQEEVGPHVLTQHPTTLFEPTVLRVEAEFRIPGDRARTKPSSIPLEREVFSCVVCGQVSQDASELETHLRKHKDYFTYGCNICGRRFREPWFLKNHMKMHGNKQGAKSKALQDLETPVMINGVIKDQTTEQVVTIYKMCMVCGFFFPDQDSLVEHSKVHNRETEADKGESKDNQDAVTKSLVGQETFLQSLNLQPCSEGNDMQLKKRSSKWIAQLDPFNTYQAWQLATKGKIAVGPNNAKDMALDASTDNEDSGSDKEELSNIWSEGHGDKDMKEDLGKELKPRQQIATTPEPAPRMLLQKDKDKERPTTCEDCGKTFRTYHQLVLHSRVHKRDRGGGVSPAASSDGKLSRAGSLEEGFEDGFEETVGSEKGEDGFGRSKVKNRECCYCGKTFRSNYYLTVHLRTHTGEKPFKCMYCTYAAAQKTSLKYHVVRRHKDKPCQEIASGPVPFLNNEKSVPIPNRSKLWVPGPKVCTTGKPEDIFDGSTGKLAKPLTQMNAEYGTLIAKHSYSLADDVHIKCPIPVSLKMEPKEIKDESSEAPLNLSLKVSLSLSASSEPRNALIPIACSFCAYKTLYPEVLIIHKKLSHKDKSGFKNGFRGSLKPTRYTGCPPALNGKDVAPLPMIGRSHPRRTQSPTSQPAKHQEKTHSFNPPNALKQSLNPANALKQSLKPANALKQPPNPLPQHEAAQETHQYRTMVDTYVPQGSPAFTELVKKPTSGVMDKLNPPDKVGIGEIIYPVRGGVDWSSDAARRCLSTRFGSLPQMDYGESSNKRLKYTMPIGRETDNSEMPGFRQPGGDGSNRLPAMARNVNVAFPFGTSSTVSEALGPVKTTSAIGGSIDSEWNMMNILRSYTHSDLSSFYHSTIPNSGHGGLSNSRAGSRTLYQHLPTLPNLQITLGNDLPRPFPNERYGPTEKSS